jgi:rhomboid family GlyGly-CTERM serine protease
MTYWPDGLQVFRYDRAAISSGQVWRLVTGHLVHVNSAHLFFDLLGLFLLAEAFWGQTSAGLIAGLLVTSSFAISALFWIWQPQLSWYAGLSGVLHALWAACTLWGVFQKHVADEMPAARQPWQITWSRLVSFAGIILLIVKLWLEWRYGASSHTEQVIGAPVVTTAHRYGALVGAIYALAYLLFLKVTRKNRV